MKKFLLIYSFSIILNRSGHYDIAILASTTYTKHELLIAREVYYKDFKSNINKLKASI